MGTKVLIVDDEPDVEKMILSKFRKRINNKELEFFFACNGTEAMTVLQNNPSIGVILTDINMPVMDGLTLLGKLLELGRAYKAVVVSAYEDMGNIRTAMNRGASDFITKPIDFNDFEQTLDRMIAEYTTLFYFHDMQKELSIAKKMQEDMLPSNFNPFPEIPIDIAGRMIPAKEIGGDFFEFFRLDENRLCVLIADVSGKSISACLYMTVSKVLFNMFARNQTSASQVMTMLNALLYAHGGDQFVTAFYGIIDFKEGTLSYCNAGHNHPVIVRKDGTIEPLNLMGGVALGIGDPDTPLGTFVEETVKVQDGDFLYLYTDGVNEAMNPQAEMFGLDRLYEVLKEKYQATSNEIVDAVVHKIKDFAQDTPQSDDITMLIVRFKSKT